MVQRIIEASDTTCVMDWPHEGVVDPVSSSIHLQHRRVSQLCADVCQGPGARIDLVGKPGRHHRPLSIGGRTCDV